MLDDSLTEASSHRRTTVTFGCDAPERCGASVDERRVVAGDDDSIVSARHLSHFAKNVPVVLILVKCA